MIHRSTPFDFKLKPWPYGFGQFIRCDGLADFYVHDLAYYLYEKLRLVPSFTVFANSISLVNVYSPFSGFSYGRLAVPKKQRAPFMPRLVFTFTRDKFVISSDAHRMSDQVYYLSDSHGVPRAAMVSVSNILAKRFGVYSVQSIDMECFYTLVGLVTKVLLTNRGSNTITKDTAVADVINSRCPFEFWGESLEMWDTKLLGQTHVNQSYAVGLSALRFSPKSTQYLDLLLPKFKSAVNSCAGNLNKLVNVLPDVYVAQELAFLPHKPENVGRVLEHAVSLLIDDSAVHELFSVNGSRRRQ